MAENILQGLLTHKAVFLSNILGAQIAAETDDAEVMRFVVPFRFHFIGFAYDIQVAGSTGSMADLRATIGGTDITTAVAPADGAGVKKGYVEADKRGLDYAANSIVKIEADTDTTNSTIEIGSTVTIVVQPIGGK